jgi:peptide/nickel transport system substrate-binding protein
VDVVTDGIAPVADSWIPPTGELRQQVQADIPQFPLDLARAQQLLEAEGWVRGPDGVRVNAMTGERLEILLYGSMVGSTEREQNVIAEGWKAVGVAPKFYVIPSALSTDREHRAKLPGLGLVGVGFDAWVTDRLHSKTIPSDANRWNGANRGGYVNPRVDAVLDRLVVTIDPAARLPLHRELLREQMGEVALMPLYWNADPVLALKGLTGIPKTEGKAAARAIFSWRKE